MKYSVLITTYHKRFEEWLKPLVIEIKKQRPDVELIISANGELEYFNEEYRKNLLDLLKDYKNTFPIVYPRFRSLARMWNLGVQFATEEKILILSDDITLEEGFFDQYEYAIASHDTFAINLSFSVFTITKKDLLNMGWFEERLLGMGWEDGDFMKKFHIYKGEKFPNVLIETCKNAADPNYFKVYNAKLEKCLKEEVRLDGQRLDEEFHRYSQFNYDIHNAKLAPVNPYPLELFYLENRHRL
jgi:hypothetical protein